MKKTYIIYIFLLLIQLSCTDILSTEENVSKELILEVLSPADSLAILEFQDIDFGRVRMRTVNTQYAGITNPSDAEVINIYKVEQLGSSNMFEIIYPQGLPFSIGPQENTILSKKLKVKFNASTLIPGFYSDTLMFNGDQDLKIAIKAEIIY